MTLAADIRLKHTSIATFAAMLVCLFSYLSTFVMYPSIMPVRHPASVHDFLFFISLHSFLGIVLALLLHRCKRFYGIIACALFILPRVLIFPMMPWLSDDVFRYLWDGTLLASNINPYSYIPIAAELSAFRNHHTELYALLDYRNLPTIYPPLAEYAFAGAVVIGKLFSPSWQGGYWSWKVILLLSEATGCWFTWKTLHRLRQHPIWLLVYLCMPLSVVEIAGQAHIDGLLFAPLGVLMFGIARHHKNLRYHIILSATLLALLAAIKILPIVLALPFFRWWRTISERGVFFTALIMISLAIWLLLFTSPGIPTAFIHTASAIAQRFQFNGGLYYGLCYVCALVGIEQFWLYTPLLFTYLRLLTVLGIASFSTMRNYQPWRALLAVFSAVLLISPKVHTWYFLPLLLLNSMVGWRWLYVLASGSMLSYSYYAVTPSKEQYAMEMAVWVVSGGVAVWEYVQRKGYTKPSAEA